MAKFCISPYVALKEKIVSGQTLSVRIQAILGCYAHCVVVPVGDPAASAFRR